MIQSGAPSSDSSCMDYLRKEWGDKVSKFSSEVNKRIRFNHRGLLALAIPLENIGQSTTDDETLFGQFFITLDETPWLDGKNVIIGTVNGPTVFNALRLGRTEVADEETGEPIDPDTAPVIKSVTVVDHSLEDLVPNRNKFSWIPKKLDDGVKKKKIRKGKRDLNVLSFGNDDEMEIFHATEPKSKGMKSIHDVVADSSFLESSVINRIQENGHDTSGDNSDGLGHMKPLDAPEQQLETTPTDSVLLSDEILNEEPMNLQEEISKKIEIRKNEEMFSKNDEKDEKISNHIEGRKANRQALLAKHSKGVKNAIVGNAVDKAMKKHSENGLISEVQARRAKYLKRKKDHGNRDNDTFAKLQAFQNKVHKIKSESKQVNSNSVSNDSEAKEVYRGQILEATSDEEIPSKNWLLTSFKCKKHIDHESRLGTAIGGDGRSADDYVVIDKKTFK